MDRVLDITNVRQKFGTLVDEVFYKKDTITIERKGKPLAKLVPLENDIKRSRLLNELQSLPAIAIDEDPTEILRNIRYMRAQKYKNDK